MKFLILGVVLLAGVAVLGVAMMLLSRREQNVSARLRGYSADAPQESSGLHVHETRLADTQLLQDAAAATGRVAERVGLLTRVEGMLERADLPVRASEVLFLYLVGLVVVFVAAALLAGDVFLGLLIVLLLAVFPVLFLRIKAMKRLSSFAQQLPDVLHLLAGALRAGFSFMQALESVAQETTGSARKELTRVVNEATLGRPPEESLEDSAERMGSDDLKWAVMAVRIQREVGGNLAEILETVANTMTERERLRREIKALTAEGRFSAIILGIFPVAFGIFLYVLQPEFISLLFERTGGQIALAGAGVLTLVGYLWLNKIMKIEV